jgi:hypothetical protein
VRLAQLDMAEAGGQVMRRDGVGGVGQQQSHQQQQQQRARARRTC